MEGLPDKLLLEAYMKAVELKLNPDFISLIQAELERRGLEDQ